MTVHLSSGIRYLTVKIIQTARKMVVYINSHEIEEVEKGILELITAIEHKKAAVMMKGGGGVSGSVFRRQFTRTDSLNDTTESIEEGDLGVTVPVNDRPLESPRPNFRNSEIGEKLEKVLVGLDEEKDFKVKAREMIVKPNKATGQKAVY